MPEPCSERVSEIRKLEILASIADKWPAFSDTKAAEAIALFYREEGLRLKEGMRGELVLDTGLVIDLVYVPDGKGGYVLAPQSDPIKHGRGVLYHGCGSNRGAIKDIIASYQLSGVPQPTEAAKG